MHLYLFIVTQIRMAQVFLLPGILYFYNYQGKPHIQRVRMEKDMNHLETIMIIE